MKKCFGILVIVYLFICCNAISVMAAPTTISPGNSQSRVYVSECCPTFSWGPVEGADGYEIAVFVIRDPEQIVPETLYDELLQISEPGLTIKIQAPALSWTPTKEQGFISGQTYAWHIRSLKQYGPGEWSPAAFFKVPETTISNLDSAVNEAVTSFLTEDDENFTFWSGLEERISEIVTDKVTESSISASDTYLRDGSESTGTNVWYGLGAADAIANASDVSHTLENVFIGRDAGANTYDADGSGGADFNVFVGNASGIHNTSGYSNSFFGHRSGRTNTSGYSNSFFGHDSGYENTSGHYNSFFGHCSGVKNTTGNWNSFFGSGSGYSNTSGIDNSFFGFKSGELNTEGNCNAFFGFKSGELNTEGNYNAFFGYGSGCNNTEGNYNTFFGTMSGYKNETGIANVFIGCCAGYNEIGSNKLYIANSDTGAPLIYGDFAASQLKINGSLECTVAFVTSDRRWKKDIKPLDNSLAKVQQLDGKSYLWRRDEFPDKGFSDQRQIGLIAQEVEEVIPEIVNTDKDGYKSISYTQLVPLLVEAVKEQQEAVKELIGAVNSLKNENAELWARVKKMER